jgi:hypothetical protein
VAVDGSNTASITGQICPVIPEQIAKIGSSREKKVNNFKARDEEQYLDTVGVRGSIPLAPTSEINGLPNVRSAAVTG